MLRTKGEAGTGNVVEAVRHARAVQKGIRMLAALNKDELFVAAKVSPHRHCPAYILLISNFEFILYCVGYACSV